MGKKAEQSRQQTKNWIPSDEAVRVGQKWLVAEVKNVQSSPPPKSVSILCDSSSFVSLTIFQYVVITFAMIIMIAIAVLQAYVQTISFEAATTLMVLEGITRTTASGLMIFLLIFFTFRIFRYAIQMNTNLLPGKKPKKKKVIVDNKKKKKPKQNKRFYYS